MKDMVQRLAQEKIQPLVKKMDNESKMDKSVIDLLFQNGVINLLFNLKYLKLLFLI